MREKASLRAQLRQSRLLEGDSVFYSEHLCVCPLSLQSATREQDQQLARANGLLINGHQSFVQAIMRNSLHSDTCIQKYTYTQTIAQKLSPI